MRIFLLIFSALFLASLNSHGEQILEIDDNCLYISDIADIDVKKTIKCGFDYGETYFLHKYKIRNIAQKYNLKKGVLKYNDSLTVMRTGKRLSADKIESVLLKSIESKHPDVDVEIEKIRYSNEIWTNEKGDFFLKIPEDTFGSTYFKVNNGNRDFRIYAYIRGYKDAYVTTDRVRKATPFTGKVEIKKVDITNARDQLVEDPSKYISARTIAEGRIVDESLVMHKPDSIKGSKVKIMFKKGNMKLTTTGILQEHAYKGKIVRVKNESSGKIITTKYIGNGVVTANY